MNNSPLTQILVILCSAIMLATAIYLLSIYKRLFARIRDLWLRRNLAVLLVSMFFMFSLIAVSSEIFILAKKKGWLNAILTEIGQSAVIVFFVFNTVWLVTRVGWVKSLSFVKQHAVIILSIVLSAFVVYTVVNYFNNDMHFKNLRAALMFSFYNSFATGLIYTAVHYVELDRKRQLNEKELELVRLSELKTKAELEALHSKVNPHFLYNALNSIADLSITDGKKARRMTIALADLFRYSINYSNNNYSTIKDEVAMTAVYLEIEKIRFEDQLNFSVSAEEELSHYLIPRFMLQPLAENAVKHGLKATGKMTEIKLSIKKDEAGMLIIVEDNGPSFPEQITPGYGVKSVFDKLDLLFPNQYEIRFLNEPQKQVVILITKLTKNEPAI